MILEQLEKIEPVPVEKNQIEGEALFSAPLHFTMLPSFGQNLMRKYGTNRLRYSTRLKSDIGEKSIRSSVEETYTKITNDLNRLLYFYPSIAHIKQHQRSRLSMDC
ncbi:Uncharacterised protein [Sphingobacterium daejeonense]|nr:Uncharacterised protein [Sphingobacterium daejeonense]